MGEIELFDQLKTSKGSERSLERNGNASSRRNGMAISRNTFNRIVRELRVHPYVLTKRQALRPHDPAQRLEFCRWFVNKANDDAEFLQNLVTSDEAFFP